MIKWIIIMNRSTYYLHKKGQKKKNKEKRKKFTDKDNSHTIFTFKYESVQIILFYGIREKISSCYSSRNTSFSFYLQLIHTNLNRIAKATRIIKLWSFTYIVRKQLQKTKFILKMDIPLLMYFIFPNKRNEARRDVIFSSSFVPKLSKYYIFSLIWFLTKKKLKCALQKVEETHKQSLIPFIFWTLKSF